MTTAAAAKAHQGTGGAATGRLFIGSGAGFAASVEPQRGQPKVKSSALPT